MSAALSSGDGYSDGASEAMFPMLPILPMLPSRSVSVPNSS
jgi:hypothetical protein